ncbi:MAG TPA: ABC transporter ATP-binding protein [Thermoplasmataceae archaeon]|nr:ABC transporter ATP-binding protein [Thermoplasmataceae archaeon]
MVLVEEETLSGTHTNCISVNDVTKSYGKNPALSGLSFSIPCGEKYSLIGPNGAGKSTTLKLLVGLLVPDRGSVSIDGIDPTTKRAKKLIGYLPEDASPYNTLSVRENLEYIGAIREVQNLRERVDQLIYEMGLSEYEKSKVSKLSRGNRQKLAVALSVIHEPDILLLDEPLNYLDIPTQEKTISIFDRLNATVLVSTHIMSIAERLTHGAIVISRGRTIWDGTMEQLKQLGDPTEAIEKIVMRLMTGAAPTH